MPSLQTVAPEKTQVPVADQIETAKINAVTKDYLRSLNNYFGTSHVMRNLYDSVMQLGKSRTPVLLYGESGTGKELIARAIHMASGKKGGFLAFNVASLPASMVEAELFGYDDGHKGVIEMCQNGTLYLEGVEGFSIKAQRRLLNVLKSVNSDGDMRKKNKLPRLICSNRRKLDELVKEGQFLPELHRYVNGIPLYVPALRERAEDVPILAGYFIDQYSGRKKVKLSKEATQLLQDYTWPGNIQELSSILQRILMNVESTTLDVETLRRYMPRQGENLKNFCLPEAAHGCLEHYFSSLKGMAPAPKLHEKVMHEVEKPLIEHVLHFAKGNQLRTAEILGLNRNTLRKKIQTLNIDVKKLARR